MRDPLSSSRGRDLFRRRFILTEENTTLTCGNFERVSLVQIVKIVLGADGVMCSRERLIQGKQAFNLKRRFNIYSSNKVESKNTTHELKLNRISVRYCYRADYIPENSYASLKSLFNVLITRVKEIGGVCLALDHVAVVFLTQQ